MVEEPDDNWHQDEELAEARFKIESLTAENERLRAIIQNVALAIGHDNSPIVRSADNFRGKEMRSIRTTITCDQCGKPIFEPYGVLEVTVRMPREHPAIKELDFCSFDCMAKWAMSDKAGRRS